MALYAALFESYAILPGVCCCRRTVRKKRAN